MLSALMGIISKFCQKPTTRLGRDATRSASPSNCNPVIKASLKDPVASEMESLFFDVLQHLEAKCISAVQDPGFLQTPVRIDRAAQASAAPLSRDRRPHRGWLTPQQSGRPFACHR